MPTIKLSSKDARSKLKPHHEPYWMEIDRGFHLGYRKGVWYVRRYHQGRYIKKRLGLADDNQKADNITVLSFSQARRRATAYEDVLEHYEKPQHPALYTIGDAVRDYLDWYRLNRKAITTTEQACNAHILPKLGKVPVASLTTAKLRKWAQDIATSPPRSRRQNPLPPYAEKRDTGKRTPGVGHVIYEYVPIPYDEWSGDMKRKRQATSNRVLTVLKASLNHAWHEDRVSNQEVWAKVKPFQNVDMPRVHYLNEEQAVDLLEAASNDFRPIVEAALLTGCRYGELASLQARDFHATEGGLLIREAKSNKPRTVPLTIAGVKFFKKQAKCKKQTDYLLSHRDGSQWLKSHQTRPMREACEAAGIDPPINFHGLRHTFATLLLKPSPDGSPGVPIRFVAEALGNSVRICEKHYAHVMQSDLRGQLERSMPSFERLT